MHYNFVRIHKAHRVTAAMQAGVTGELWRIDHLVNLLREPVYWLRGPYRKRQSKA